MNDADKTKEQLVKEIAELPETESAKLLGVDAVSLDAVCEDTNKAMKDSSHIF